MNPFRKYLDYIQDNPEGYWFKRKLYGWGWTPATREGWFVVLLFIIAIVALSSFIEEHHSARELLINFFLPFGGLVFLLIYITYRTGEPPKWQWGFPKRNKRNKE